MGRMLSLHSDDSRARLRRLRRQVRTVIALTGSEYAELSNPVILPADFSFTFKLLEREDLTGDNAICGDTLGDNGLIIQQDRRVMLMINGASPIEIAKIYTVNNLTQYRLSRTDDIVTFYQYDHSLDHYFELGSVTNLDPFTINYFAKSGSIGCRGIVTDFVITNDDNGITNSYPFDDLTTQCTDTEGGNNAAWIGVTGANRESVYEQNNGAFLGENIITNGRFYSDTIWALSTSVSINDSKARLTSSASGHELKQNVITRAYYPYLTEFNLINYQFGSVRVQLESRAGSFVSNEGFHTDEITPVGSSRAFLRAGGASTTTDIKNFTVRLRLKPSLFDLNLRDEVQWPSADVLAITDESTRIKAQTDSLNELLNTQFRVKVVAGTHHVVRENSLGTTPAATIFASNSDIQITGTLDNQGNIVSFIHVDNETDGGFNFFKCKHVLVKDLNVQWTRDTSVSDEEYIAPTRNHNGTGVMSSLSDNIIYDNVHVLGAPGAGLASVKSKNATIINSSINETGADGIHFADTDGVHISDCETYRSGDDGIAFVAYQNGPVGRTVYAKNLKVENVVHGRGIAVVGYINVEIYDFIIDKTASNGLHIEQDANPTPTYISRYPRNIKIGVIDQTVNTIKNAGIAGTLGNKYGLNLLRANDVSLSDIDIFDSLQMQISIVSCEKFNIQRITTQGGAPTNNMRVVNSSGSINDVRLENFDISNPGNGKMLLVENTHDVVIRNLTVALIEDYYWPYATQFTNNTELDADVHFEHASDVDRGLIYISGSQQSGKLIIDGDYTSSAVIHNTSPSLTFIDLNDVF